MIISANPPQSTENSALQRPGVRPAKGVKPQFGAVGKHGSIAVVEHFIRTLKDECTRRVVVPLRRDIGLRMANGERRKANGRWCDHRSVGS